MPVVEERPHSPHVDKLPHIDTHPIGESLMERPERFVGLRLMFLFVATYLTHGIATQFGLIAQPLQYWLMKDLHMSAAQVSSYLAIMMLPWFLEGAYGVICDFVPLFGYRRKGYLLAGNLLAGLAFAAITGTSSLAVVFTALVLSAIGISISIAVTAGLAVCEGKVDGKIGDYLVVQMVCYYATLIASGVVGGLLCQYLAPKSALHSAAGISATAAVLVACLVPWLHREEKSHMNMQRLRETWASLKAAFRCRPLQLAAVFIACWCFSPSFGVPLYFHESNALGFSQQTIGQLFGWNSAGMLLGAALYWRLIKSTALRSQLYTAVAVGTTSTLAYLLLSSPVSAIALELFRGTANMIALLTIRTLAAAVCPKHIEVAVMASLFAVWDLATDGSTYIGGQIFSNVFHNQFAPLVLVAACATALCALLVPFLCAPAQEEISAAQPNKVLTRV